MVDESEPRQGRIVIEWSRNPSEADSDLELAWELRSDPPIADELVEIILSEVLERV